MKNSLYLSPEIRVVKLSLERGFATSLENPETNPEIDW